MTDTQLTIILASIPTTIAALGAFWQSVKASQKAQVNIEKTELVSRKADEIHTLTDGNLSKVSAALDVAKAEVAGLKVLVGTLVESNRQAIAATLPGPAGPAGPTGEVGPQGQTGERGEKGKIF